MDLPARVVIYCPALELKNKPGRLVALSPQGYYEVLVDIGERTHTALLPIHSTALVFADPQPASETMPDLER
jgi:hypothetical protein